MEIIRNFRQREWPAWIYVTAQYQLQQNDIFLHITSVIVLESKPERNRERYRAVTLTVVSFVVFADPVTKDFFFLGYKVVSKITGSLCFEATERLLLQG
jgi:hypothetical protein